MQFVSCTKQARVFCTVSLCVRHERVILYLLGVVKVSHDTREEELLAENLNSCLSTAVSRKNHVLSALHAKVRYFHRVGEAVLLHGFLKVCGKGNVLSVLRVINQVVIADILQCDNLCFLLLYFLCVCNCFHASCVTKVLCHNLYPLFLVKR